MKNLSYLSIGLLFLTFSCETEAIRESEPTIVYTNQQVVTNQSFIIDFESYSAGDIVSELMINDPFNDVEIEGITMAFPNDNAAMIFDSSNPSGGDFDIGTPNEQYGGPGVGNGGASNDIALGNVLILSEDLDSNDPDDIFEIGASFQFDFSANQSVTLNSFDILDIEESSNPTSVRLYDQDQSILLDKEIIPGGDNSKTTVDLENTENVAFMEIIMNSSGAIDNIAFEMQTEEACVECDGDIVSLDFRYNGTNDAEVRIETTDGIVLFEATISQGEAFNVTANDQNGLFSGDLVVFVNNEQLTTLATDCSQIIGPGFLILDLEIIAGETATGGVLCPVEVVF